MIPTGTLPSLTPGVYMDERYIGEYIAGGHFTSSGTRCMHGHMLYLARDTGFLYEFESDHAGGGIVRGRCCPDPWAVPALPDVLRRQRRGLSVRDISSRSPERRPLVKEQGE